jgi:hypothetical protein
MDRMEISSGTLTIPGPIQDDYKVTICRFYSTKIKMAKTFLHQPFLVTFDWER